MKIEVKNFKTNGLKFEDIVSDFSYHEDEITGILTFSFITEEKYLDIDIHSTNGYLILNFKPYLDDEDYPEFLSNKKYFYFDIFIPVKSSVSSQLIPLKYQYQLVCVPDSLVYRDDEIPVEEIKMEEL